MCRKHYLPNRFIVSLLILKLIVGYGGITTTSAQTEEGQNFSGRVLSIEKGDTFTVRKSNGEVVDITLYGVAAPDSRQPYGAKAIRRARVYVLNREVQVKIEGKDSSGQILASVEIRGRDVGAMLIQDGLAWHDIEEDPENREYAWLENWARDVDRGLWSQSNPVPPWSSS